MCQGFFCFAIGSSIWRHGKENCEKMNSIIPLLYWYAILDPVCKDYEYTPERTLLHRFMDGGYPKHHIMGADLCKTRLAKDLGKLHCVVEPGNRM